jgi:hypothetical protein
MVGELGMRAFFAPSARRPAAAYYSPAMQASRLRELQRRPRRGSLERPLDGRLVRATSLLVVLPLLVLAFTTSRTGPLPAPALPASFDGVAAMSLTAQLARRFPSRVPGSGSDAEAAQWVASTLELYGLATHTATWRQKIPDLGNVQLTNVSVVIPGSSPGVIVVEAHRDNSGVGAGANDNATGTATLIELARAYSTVGTTAARPRPLHTIVFLSGDAGAYGGFGAAHFTDRSIFRRQLRAAVVLDALGGTRTPRLEIAGDGAHGPSAALVRTAVARVAEQTGSEPGLPGVLRQLVDLGIPFAYGDQAPFLGASVPALRLTTADDTGRSDSKDALANVDARRLGQLGAASQNLLGSLDNGLELAQGAGPKLVLGSRFVNGWALELVLLVSLVPFVVGVGDMMARCRRLGVPLAPGFRALRRRLGYWLSLALLLWLGGVAGFLPTAGGRPLPPAAHSAAWPLAGVALGIGIAVAAWFVARRRLVPVHEPDLTSEVGGYVTALVGLGGLSVAVALVHALALVFVLPSLYAWLWLPRRFSRRWLPDVLFGCGLAGAVAVLVSMGGRFQLGIRTPLYLADLVSVGYVPWLSALLTLAWVAITSQVAATAAGRYGPYAGGAPRPPRGLIRESVRRGVVAVQSRRR